MALTGPLLIFDLDGTLIDSKLDLAHAVNAARAHLGMGPIQHDLVFSYVGNGAPVLMRRALGPEASDSDVKRALEFFIHYYGEHCLDHTSLYPGVKDALDRLHTNGVAMAVLTISLSGSATTSSADSNSVRISSASMEETASNRKSRTRSVSIRCSPKAGCLATPPTWSAIARWMCVPPGMPGCGRAECPTDSSRKASRQMRRTC